MTAQASASAPSQVTVPGVGSVTMAALDELRDALRAAETTVDQLAAQAAELEATVEDRLADAGAHLAPRRGWWQVPAVLTPRLNLVDRLVARISDLDRRAPSGPRDTALPARLRRWRRARAAARLREALVAIARAGAEAGIDVPGVEPLLEQAAELETRAAGLRSALEAATARRDALSREVRLRDDGALRFGFDSLYLAGYFRAYGMPVIESPVALDRGEVAHLAVEATLARPAHRPPSLRRTAGRVSVAQTGVSHWVGMLRGQQTPLLQPYRIDAGVLVVSNLRLAFAGSAEFVAVPLASMLELDVYQDGIAATVLGREAPHVFLVEDPRMVAFYANWALSGAG